MNPAFVRAIGTRDHGQVDLYRDPSFGHGPHGCPGSPTLIHCSPEALHLTW